MGVQPIASGADIANHDGQMLKPQVMAATVRRHRPARPAMLVEDEDLTTQAQGHRPAIRTRPVSASVDDLEIEG
jgi:hypothetical protein